MARNRPEEQFHRSVAAFLRACCPDLVWFAVANQRGARPRWEMGVLQALGVRPGVSDLVLVLDHGQIGCIELKAPQGRLSPAQKLWRADVEKAGGKWAMCRTLDELVVILARWGVPMRAHVPIHIQIRPAA